MPGKADVADIYEVGGLVLAGTGNQIGIPLDGSDQIRWGRIMRGLVSYDEISEADPREVDDPARVLDCLGLDTTDERLADHAKQLAEASQEADRAPTIVTHFDQRKREAVSCANLLRYSCKPGLADAYERQWDQIARLSEAGIFLDSTRDAKEDVVDKLPQFTSRQLALGGLWRAGQTMLSVKPETWVAFVGNMRKQGFNVRLRSLARFSLCVHADKMLQITLPEPGTQDIEQA
jgi:hypothetical protein